MFIELSFVDPGIALLMVNRPHVRNALNWQAMQEFKSAIEEAHNLPDLKALILTGAGTAFISGGDLRELADYSSEADGWRLTDIMTTALNLLESLPCPTIAAVNGPARGGGAEIALACDLRIISEGADLGFVHINLGISPAWGGANRLVRLVGYSRAIVWLLCGRVLSAEEAMNYGLANQKTPSGEALSEAIALARRLADKPQRAVRAIKRLLRASQVSSSSFALSLEQEEFVSLWAGDDHLQAISAFLNKR